MKFPFTRFAALVLAVWSMNGIAGADTLLFSDNFDSYTDGNLVPQGGWGNQSGTGSFVQVASGTIALVQGSGSREDVRHDFGLTMAVGDVWRYEFDVTVNGAADATDVYFAHFKDAGTGTAFNSRLFVAAPNVATGNFTFGVSETTSTVNQKFGTDFSFGTTYRVFAEYNFDLGSSRVWIDNIANGVIISTDLDLMQPMAAIGFRQAAGNTSQIIDNFDVYSVAIPEPASAGFVLLMIAGISGIRCRYQLG